MRYLLLGWSNDGTSIVSSCTLQNNKSSSHGCQKTLCKESLYLQYFHTVFQMSHITGFYPDLFHLLLPDIWSTHWAVLHCMSPWAHCEGCRRLELAVTCCAVHLSGLSAVRPALVIQLVISESLPSDLVLLLGLLSATLHAMVMSVSPITTFSEKIKKSFLDRCHTVVHRNFMFWAVGLDFLSSHRWKESSDFSTEGTSNWHCLGLNLN